MKLQYKRIMLKLSGEVLLGNKEWGIDPKKLHELCSEIALVKKSGVEIVIVIGGGNIWRYRQEKDTGLDRVTLDNMGMIATVMNALAMENMFEKLGIEARVSSSLDMSKIAEPYLRQKALHHLKKGRIVLCAGGTGSPFFTTDSAAAIRALELGCDVLMKATKVDYVYDRDPEKFKNAKKLEHLTYHEVLERDLTFMDQAAIALCREGPLPIIVFNLEKRGNILRSVSGEKIGTVINV